jgi:hypothetical protein
VIEEGIAKEKKATAITKQRKKKNNKKNNKKEAKRSPQ